MAQNNFNDYQFGEENLRWLSLLPLFETEHWPIEATVNQDPWLATCICWREEHHTVSLFPYARYTGRAAWYEMEDTLAEVQDFYEEYPQEREDAIVEICESWPAYFRAIFLQDATSPSDGWCLNTEDPCLDTPYAYPYWDRFPLGDDYCNCQPPVTPVEEFSEEESEDDEEMYLSDVWGLVANAANMGFFQREPERLVFEDGTTMAVPHFRIDSVIPFKGFRISPWEEWNYQVVDDVRPVDEPPAYGTVSELPSYEEATEPPRYESLFW